jgi:hypothetical protein
MKKFINLCNTLGIIGIELIQDFFRMVKNGIPVFSTILKASIPYMMYYFGKYESNKIYWLFLPMVSWFVTIVLDRLAEKTGKGKNIPVPIKRFTEEDSDGEVSIEQSRLQEMILYVNDVENYLERHHLM